MAEQLDLAALRREREARRGKPAPVAAAASADASGGQRLDGEKVEAPPAKRARAGSSSGPVIYVGGALKDARGHHSLRPPAVPAAAYEVDCRRSSTEVKVTGRVATFAAGLGTLNDKKTGSDAERRHATEFLLRDAREIDLRRSRGEDTWVHCAQASTGARRASSRICCSTRTRPSTRPATPSPPRGRARGPGATRSARSSSNSRSARSSSARTTRPSPSPTAAMTPATTRAGRRCRPAQVAKWTRCY